MRVIVFSNKKGGVGKTTSALATAAGLAKAGYKVLAIDMDGQGNFGASSGGEKNVKGTYDFLKGDSLEAVLQSNGVYDFIAGDKRLSNAESDFPRIGSEGLLRKALKKVDAYDFVIVDTPPSMGLLTLNALVVANDLIICAQSDAYSVAGCMELFGNVELVRENYNENLRIAGILLTRYSTQTNISKQMLPLYEQAAQVMGALVFKTKIRENIKLTESQVMNKPIYKYAPESNGAKDYEAFLNEYLEGMKNNG